jgi:hypothetical protein
MIVINKDTSATVEHLSTEQPETLESLFRKEIDAYCAYKKWCEETDDEVLEMALEEIMMDEFLHANFLRDYLMDNHMYTLSEDDPHEKKFWKIKKRFFRD